MEEVKERFAVAGSDPSPGTPEKLASHMKGQIEKGAKVVKASGGRGD